MRVLAIDIGRKRTGIAFLDSSVMIPLPLPTIHAEKTNALIDAVLTIAQERSVEKIVVGLPLLPSGKPGAQASFVLDIVERLRERTPLPIATIDERYSTPRKARASSTAFKGLDLDGMAACSLLEAYLGI